MMRSHGAITIQVNPNPTTMDDRVSLISSVW